jgi:aminoglycoside 6-adenylyltransferase
MKLWGLQVPEQERLQQLTAWGQGQETVRAMVLTSTRTVPGMVVDILSDYDVIIYVCDVLPFFESRDWLAAFGEVLALYRDPLETRDGFQSAGFVVQFVGGLKIDFTISPVAALTKIVQDQTLPAEYDAGYRVLLDKDHLAQGLPTPTYQAYIPKPPSQERFNEVIESFFLDATYVARYLWRDEVLAARAILEQYMKQENLLPVLWWLVEIDHGWKVKPGLYGRGLRKWLRSDLWQDLIGTCPNAELSEIWRALEKTLDLMHRVGSEVGAHFDYAYPEECERLTRAYIDGIRNLEREKSLNGYLDRPPAHR